MGAESSDADLSPNFYFHVRTHPQLIERLVVYPVNA